MTKKYIKHIKLDGNVEVTSGNTDGVIYIISNNKKILLTSTVLRLMVKKSNPEIYSDINQQLLAKYNI